MIKRVIHISTPSELSLKQSQLVITQSGQPHTVPIEDIGVVILDEPTITISHPLLSRLATEGVMVVTSDEHHLPIGLLLPLSTHSTPSLYYQDQITASLPTKKQIWQSLIRAKLLGQSRVLQKAKKEYTFLSRLSEQVKSGDSGNLEAQGARYYWRELFGGDFDRGRYGDGVNPALNYGYALIRSTLARAVVGAGLLPMIGIWHDNRYNAFNLVDDLIEPLRPMVDRLVWLMSLQYGSLDPLTSPMKRELCTLLTRDLIWR